MSIITAVILGLVGALEVSGEPVAIVVAYPGMQDISLSPEDVMIYSEDLPRVETIVDAPVVYSQRTMSEMVAANVPEPPPESKPTLPNESRQKKRLDHTPPFNGTVTGDVTIIKSGANERIILITNLKGDGVMQVLVKGGTAKSARGGEAKPVVDTPRIVVRNTKATTNIDLGRAATVKSAGAMAASQRASMETHFQGKLPANLRVVAEPITVE
ncbi:MAG: hypothetical protein KF886_22695 [Candidatus Hydrogenedentes bacterium]|nr:hypothetical protein [Candidatus Hydrogenedentota bacterium]